MNSEKALRDLYERLKKENVVVELEDVLPILKQAKEESRVGAIRQFKKEFDQVYEAFL